MKNISLNFNKKFNNALVKLAIIKRTGYYQDFSEIVEEFESTIKLVGDIHAHKIYSNYYTCKCEITIDDKVLSGCVEAAIKGNKFDNISVNVYKDSAEEAFPILNINTYWPNGYNNGEYNSGGCDYYLASRLVD